MRENLLLVLFLTFLGNFVLAQNKGRVEIAAKPTAASMKAGAFIDVNAPGYPESNYPINQLISDVLISGGTTCVSSNVSNVTVSPNLPATDPNRSWGYFNKSSTDFPFTKGIILSTGYANKAGNTFEPNLSDNLGTAGDPDLSAAIGTNNLHNATSIEFDFVAASTEITFRYLFASKEYQSNYPCTYTDGFALLLKKVSDPTYTNLAVLPGGAGPVSVTNIHPQYPNCGPQNEVYYAGNNTAQIETNFNGRTIPLTAKATVVPGETYHFKIVLADFNDTAYDSAVFLEAGSFDIGVGMMDPAGVQLPDSVTMCDNTPQTFTASIQGSNITYQWYQGTNAIPGATNASYTATQPGVYTVKVFIQGNNCPGEATITVVAGTSPVVQNASLSECSNSATATFNLTSAQASISTTPGAVFSYYTTLADANAGNTNTIANPAAYLSGNAIIYARVSSGACFKVAQLQLTVIQTVTPVITPSSTTICYGGSVTLTSNQTTGNVWSTGATTQSITVTSPGTYTLSNNNGCTSTSTSVTINAESNPDVQITGNLILCESSATTLTATSTGTGNTFSWSNGVNGSTNTVTAGGVYTVTVTTPSGCQYQKSVTVDQGVVPVVQNANLSECSSSATANFDLTSAQALISTTPGTVFSYYTTLADANAGNTNTIANPAAYLSGNTTIYVRVSSATCFKVAQLQLTVTQTVTPAITSSSTTICYGGSVTLTSNQTTGNIWSTGATTQSITVNSPGTYTLSNSNGSCTSTPVSVTINAESNPDVQITGNLVLCESSTTTLTATSTGTGNTFSWSNGVNGSTNTVTAGGVYTVTVTTPSGCQYQKSVTVDQGVVPVVQNATLSECSSSATANFDLTSAPTLISTTPGTVFSYYTTLADANAGNTNTIANPAAYLSGNATIYVRVSSATCFKVAQLQLTITQTVTPAITPSSTTICYGGSVTLTSNQTTGNVWSTGATTQSITVTSPGTYTLSNSNGSCTSTPVSVTINAESNPDVQITGNLVLCDPSTTTLTATSTGTGNTFSWSNGVSGSTNTVTAGGVYTVTVTTPSGCQYQKSVTVTQGVVPVAQNATLSECSSSATANFDLTSAQTLISTTPGTVFSYYTTLADANAGNTNTIANPAAYLSGNATIYVRIASATCSKVVELQLIINTNPTLVISTSAPAICNNGSVTLTSNFATGNTWSTGATTQSITITAPGTYTLTNTSGNCAIAPASITIVADVDPNVQITGNLAFCEGSSTVLTATASGTGNTFSWSNGVNGTTNTVVAGGIYTVTVTTPAGCQYQKTVTVTMDPAIIVNIATPSQITCTVAQITLDATTSVYQPGATFLWTATNGGNIVSGANTLTPIVNNGGTYTLTITSANPSGCVKQATVTVINNTTPPIISITAPALTICKGQSVTLTASGAITYTWTGLSGNGNTQTVSPTSTTTYTVTGVGINGCASQTAATITINVVPEITSALNNIEICKGDTGILDAGSGLNYTYSWNTGATTQKINVTATGTYTVTINNGTCSKSFTAAVSYILTPEITGIVYNNNTLTINAKNNGSISLEYSIDGGVTWQTSNVFTNVLKKTLYSIRVRNKETSCDTNVEYYTFFMANVITPNNDGINDVINFSEISKYGNFEGSIFDKYGKAVFKPTSKTPIWDGKYIGNPLPTDTYWYKLFWQDKISKKNVELSGWILLKNRE
ncbi:choice-of-anchor L domain-containing protein [Chryseobacterium sp. S0630]|uniref:choice-of-anchor L domain-containing protein n=1 Tax=Chryseobacterium sp. S0630 TaxID=2957803 RepID=UPI0020A132B6|nr:choice-of-anchor L domain-containing protein [Chryseobacterium sp. S0630]MCP1299624.1 choice-of-anchor L domain-containing protein [Chryseobacterium sp. S0630]